MLRLDKSIKHELHAILTFLNSLVEKVDPALMNFAAPEPLDSNPSSHRPVGAIRFSVVLHRWATDDSAKKYSNKVPWRVVAQEDPFAFDGHAEWTLWVQKFINGNHWKDLWSITCEELVTERQVLPIQQRQLRHKFSLLPRDNCPDKDFFFDKYKVLNGI